MKNAKFKDSGVQWLGEIPQHWEVVKGKRLHKCPKILNTDNACKEVLSLTLRGVVDNDMDNPEGLIPKDYATYQIFEKDDLVFKLIDLENVSTSRVGLVHKRGIMSPAYIRLQISEKCNAKFIYYFYYSLYLTKVFNHIGSGVRQTLNANDLLELEFPLPPLDEQRQIAEFLDSKCAKIAEFIDKKQQIISLLKEQKLALINESTCGRIPNFPYKSDSTKSPLPCESETKLSPSLAGGVWGGVSATMEGERESSPHAFKFKYSGIEWLGEIPQHWEVRKLKQIGVFNKGNNITKKYISDEGLPFIVYGDIYTKYNFKVLNIAQKISSENANLATLVKKNTLLFSASGEIIEDIGKCVVLLTDYAYIGGDVITLNSTNCDSVFLSYAINSAFATYQKATMGKGDIIVHIHILNLKNLQIPLPPLDEQRQIAEFLDSKCAKIDKAIALIEQEIQAIKEYKTSLIDKAVRGQI